MFGKLRVKAGMTGVVVAAPPGYPAAPWDAADGAADVVHLFVTTRGDVADRFPDAAARLREGGLFWVSYDKTAGKQPDRVNRDSLWGLVLPLGWHPVAQVALDDQWSAVRLVRNVPGVTYAAPANVRGS